jgi:adenylate kinase family enzyme/N-acetylglutamate synthase-like GNAT family acetyltransferase
MKATRIHILGPSGAGTTSLGEALARRLGATHFDADDFFWEKTDPPFTTKRSVEDRRQLLETKLAAAPNWILSGSVTGWGNFLRPVFSHVIFLTLAPEDRMKRLRERELKRYGERIAPGGDMEQIHKDFLAWAARYDEGGMDVRSRQVDETWMRALPCPVLRLDSKAPLTELTEATLKFFQHRYSEVHVEEAEGLAASPQVDPFFESLGRSTRALPGDHFFLAKCGKELLGVVRYCVEHDTPMLRGMLIAERARRQGVGQALLRAFDAYLKRHRIEGVFCVPHGHLLTFYGGIGFRRMPENQGPAFLQERLKLYRESGMPDVILMRRP